METAPASRYSARPMPASDGSDRDQNPILPIAIGFYLLSLPLWVAVALAPTPTGKWTNGAAAALLLVLGGLTHARRR